MSYYTNKVAVITGAGSGLGRALAVALAAEGSLLALVDQDQNALAATSRLCEHSQAVRSDVLDVTDEQAMLDYAEAVVAQFGRVDAVFAVAGVIHTGSVLNSSVADYDRVMRVDYFGVLHTVKALLPHLIASGGGHLATVSSAFGLMGFPGSSAYCAAKFAVAGFTEALQQEMALSKHSVSVTCVYPGGVRTPIMHAGSYAPGVNREAAIARFDSTVARTSAPEAAALILRGVRARRGKVLVGIDARLLSWVIRLAGPACQRVLPIAQRLTARGRSIAT